MITASWIQFNTGKKLPLLDLSIEHAALLLSALFVNSSLINSKGTDHPCKVNKLKAFAGKTDWDICFQRDLKYSASTCTSFGSIGGWL